MSASESQGPFHVEVLTKEAGGDVVIRLAAGKEAKRAALDVVCTIDISGSMDDEATIQTASGGVESDGLTLLDIVKHAVRTVVNALGPDDRLGLVSYSTRARVELELTHMDADGKKKAEQKLTALRTEGCTNIFDGLTQSLQLLLQASKQKKKKVAPSAAADSPAVEVGNLRIPAVLLLTDGLPNEGPKGIDGHIEALRNWAKTHCQGGPLPGIVNTFGFGYSLDSPLLLRLAEEGRGAFGFIPDAGFVGTTFVNSTANLMAASAKFIDVQLEGAKVVSGPPSVRIGTVQQGRPRDVVFRLEGTPAEGGKPIASVAVTYDVGEGPVTERTEVTRRAQVPAEVCAEVDAQVLRVEFVGAVRKAMSGNLDAGSKLMAEFSASAHRSPVSGDRRIAALLEDVDGQVAQALSKSEWYQRWGRHYLPALALAHEQQQCTNFKDPGVQLYQSKLFSDLRDTIDDLFCKIPAPVPSKPRRVASTTAYGGGGVAAAAAPIDMSAYNDCSAGCWAGRCRVAVADGRCTVRADQIRKGDVVFVGQGGATAEVVCVVRTRCDKGRAVLVGLPGGLEITPWHPVEVGGEWVFPCEVGRAREVSCEAVFTLVLGGGNGSVVVEGTRCVTLGHEVKGDKREHAYWGTSAVVEGLKRMPGWSEGLVDISPSQVIRDETSTLVSGLAIPITSEC